MYLWHWICECNLIPVKYSQQQHKIYKQSYTDCRPKNWDVFFDVEGMILEAR